MYRSFPIEVDGCRVKTFSTSPLSRNGGRQTQKIVKTFLPVANVKILRFFTKKKLFQKKLSSNVQKRLIFSEKTIKRSFWPDRPIYYNKTV
jgi:hypothetical protein